MSTRRFTTASGYRASPSMRTSPSVKGGPPARRVVEVRERLLDARLGAFPVGVAERLAGRERPGLAQFAPARFACRARLGEIAHELHVHARDRRARPERHDDRRMLATL